MKNKYGVKTLDGKLEGLFFLVITLLFISILSYVLVHNAHHINIILILSSLILISLGVVIFCFRTHHMQHNRKPNKYDQYFPIFISFLLFFYSVVILYIGFVLKQLTYGDYWFAIGVICCGVIMIINLIYLIFKQ